MVVRPRGSGLPYPRVLESILSETTGEVWVVDNLSRVAAIASDSSTYADRLVADQPEAIVIHYGHVEAVRRPHSRASWYRIHEVRPGSPRWRPLLNWFRVRSAGARRVVGLRRQWMTLASYERALDELLGYLRSETLATLILVEASPGNDRIERWGPGSLGQIARYNDVSQRAASRFGAVWLSLEQAAGSSHDEVCPDGTHLSGEGHRRLAEVLASIVLERSGAARPRPGVSVSSSDGAPGRSPG